MKATILGIILTVVISIFGNVVANGDLPKREERKSKGVTTFISAKWEATPIVLELAEYLSAESSDLFWSYFDGIISLKSSLESLGT